jgi:hypothetical protein
MASSDRALLREPLPAGWTVARGLEEYLAENGFDRALYDAPRTPASLLGVRFSVPNGPQHRWAIMRHDIHHVLTGYGTDIIGESEVSAWEMASGLPNIGLYTTGLVSGLALLGYTRFPARTFAARRAARGETLYHDRVSYEAAMATRIGALRGRFGIPERGIAGARGLHARAP